MKLIFFPKYYHLHPRASPSEDTDMHHITELMQSDRWQEKRRGELLYMRHRVYKLGRWLRMAENGQLPYKLITSIDLIRKQYDAMLVYLDALEERAKLENF